MRMNKQYNMVHRKNGLRRWMVGSGLVLAILGAQYLPFANIITAASQFSSRNNSTILDACRPLQSTLSSTPKASEPKQVCCGNISDLCCCSEVSTHCSVNQTNSVGKKDNEESQFIGACGATGGDQHYKNASLFLLNAKQAKSIIFALLDAIRNDFIYEATDVHTVSWRSVCKIPTAPLYLLYNTYRC